MNCNANPGAMSCFCCWPRAAGRVKDKVALARPLRQETTMTLNWIAERLNLAAAGSLANLLRDSERKQRLCGTGLRPVYGKPIPAMSDMTLHCRFCWCPTAVLRRRSTSIILALADANREETRQHEKAKYRKEARRQ
jgi:hypothetical protein